MTHTHAHTHTHTQEELPPWKADMRRQQLVRQLMSSNQEMYAREQLGVITKTETTCFQSDMIDELGKTAVPAAALACYHPRLFMAVDTAGGGTSCMAICSGIVTNAGVLVVRARSLSLTPFPRKSTVLAAMHKKVCVCV